MNSILKNITRVAFGYLECPFYKDIRFWLLFVVINCGANLGFNHYFEQQTVKVALFIVCCYLLNKKYWSSLGSSQILYIFGLSFILIIQSVYLTAYSATTSIHYFLMISIAVMTVAICGNSFVRYFSSIIFLYACISLVCFTLQNIGYSIPYIAITDTKLDGGIIMRVYNIYYTQLGNPAEGLGYNARNCGPFWEPGAFQGFLNLSLFFELTMNQIRDKFWKIRIIIYVIAIVTTLSTGGYIVMFVILLYYFSMDKSISVAKKILMFCVSLGIFVYLYNTLDFLGSKVTTDESRLSFSFTDFPNVMYMLFGYGYSPESFRSSSMSSASSVFNLLRYIGVTGFLIYMIALLRNKSNTKLVYFVIITLILTNEPFLSNAMIWWGVAFVSYKLYQTNISNENLSNTYPPRRTCS